MLNRRKKTPLGLDCFGPARCKQGHTIPFNLCSILIKKTTLFSVPCIWLEHPPHHHQLIHSYWLPLFPLSYSFFSVWGSSRGKSVELISKIAKREVLCIFFSISSGWSINSIFFYKNFICPFRPQVPNNLDLELVQVFFFKLAHLAQWLRTLFLRNAHAPSMRNGTLIFIKTLPKHKWLPPDRVVYLILHWQSQSSFWTIVIITSTISLPRSGDTVDFFQSQTRRRLMYVGERLISLVNCWRNLNVLQSFWLLRWF